MLLDIYITLLQGFIQDFCQEGANVAIVKLMGGEDLIVFLGFVGEGILWYNSNYSNNGGLGVLPQEFMMPESVSGGKHIKAIPCLHRL